MSQIDLREGGQHFSKMSEIQKCPKCQRGGGANPNCPKFSRFSILTPPLTYLLSITNSIEFRRKPKDQAPPHILSPNKLGI